MRIRSSFPLFVLPFLLIGVASNADETSARNMLLHGVQTIHSGVQPGHMTVLGPHAFAVANYPDVTAGPAVAASFWGDGRVVAVPDHQMLRMHQWDGQGDSNRFYRNAIEWLAKATPSAPAVPTNLQRGSDHQPTQPSLVAWSQENAGFLTRAGYRDVTLANSESIEEALPEADVFVAGWLGSRVSDRVLASIASFVKQGGGLFIAEYGVGYQWWWNAPVYEAPANRLLRDAGIVFGSGYENHTGLIALRAIRSKSLTTNDFVNANRLAALVKQTEANQLAHTMNVLLSGLPKNHAVRAAVESVLQKRAQELHATPSSPVEAPMDRAALTWEARSLVETPVQRVRAHPSALDVYGAMPDHVRPVTRSISIDLSVAEPLKEWHSIGLYAAPGQAVTIRTSSNAPRSGLAVRIGSHTDDLTPRKAWNRVPFGISRSFPIQETGFDIASAFGGMLYVEVPAGREPGLVEFEIRGAYLAPHFVLGRDSNTSWNQGIRDYPAPVAELACDQLIITLPSHYVCSLSDPTSLMEYWRDVVKAQDQLADFNPRTRPERINIDVQVSHGYLHAGYPIQGVPRAAPELVDLRKLRAYGSWGWFHELGHEHQEAASTIDGDGEVTVNLFTLYSYDQMGASSERATAQARIENARGLLESGRTYLDGGPFQKLAFYQQIVSEFGWRPFSRFYASFHGDPPGAFAAPRKNQDEMDQWLVRLSRFTGRDLSPHFEAWGFRTTPQARGAVSDLRPWSKIEVVRPKTDVLLTEGESAEVDLSQAVWSPARHGPLSFKIDEENQHFELENLGSGRFLIETTENRSAMKSTLGPDLVVFNVKNKHGGKAKLSLRIGVSEVSEDTQ
ncbi:MAG: M60 family metallopeptidase [Planctomycetota bacterium]